MIDQAREALSQLVALHGEAMLRDPARCRALLLDHCEGRLEVALLTMAVEEDVPHLLLRNHDGTPTAVLLDRLSRRLESVRGLAPDSARWAVESWALALGVGDAHGHPEFTVPASVPTPQHTTPGPPAASRWRGLRGRLTSTSGVLTGVGLVVLIGVVAAVVANGLDEPTSPEPTTTTIAPTTSTTSAYAALLSRMRPSVKPTCEPLTAQEPGRTSFSAPSAVCRPTVTGGKVTVYYYQLDATRMRAEYDRVVKEKTLPNKSCNPDTTPDFLGTGGYNAAGSSSTSGNLLCFVDDKGDPVLQWTHFPTNIYVSAYASGSDDKVALRKTLYEFWRSSGLPIS